MRRSRFGSVLALVLIGTPPAALAQELLPPQPGFTIKFRNTASQGEAPADNVLLADERAAAANAFANEDSFVRIADPVA